MWRGVSLRKLTLLLVGPFLVETISTLFMFWMGLAAYSMGIPSAQQGLIAACGSGAYCISSLMAGRWVTPRVAPHLMTGTVLMATALGVSTLYVNQYWYFLAASVVMGLFIGHYYVPFQINMSHVRPFRTLAWTVAIYNVAWSSGATAGPYISALFEKSPVVVISSIAAALFVTHTIINIVALFAPAPSEEHEPAAAFVSTSFQRWSAWAVFVIVGITFRGLLFTLLPKYADQNEWTADQKALLLAMTMVLVPAASPLWALIRRRLDRPWILLISVVIGAAGFAALPYCQTMAGVIACVLACGVMESAAVFHGIYYANADPNTRARSVGIFEGLAGMGYLTGPPLLGLIADNDATAPRSYLAAAVMLLTVALGVMWVWLSPTRSAR